MSLLIDCPLPASLSVIDPTVCALNFNQIVKVAFQRSGTTFIDITDETEWDTFLAAVDETKIIITPFVENNTIPAGELITEGFAIIALSKLDELLGSPVMGNQQPSLSRNAFEGSTTNSRVLTVNTEDSNADTSVQYAVAA